jgi:hypothetical protein
VIEGKYAIDLYKEQVLNMDLKQVEDSISGGNSTETTPLNIDTEKLLLISPTDDQ